MNCFFFTDCFPYSNKESFIENEIEHLARNYENVYIFSLCSPTKQIRRCPNNVYFFSLNISKMPFKRIRKILSGLFCKFPKIKANKLSNHFRSLYYRGGAKIAAKRALKIIKRNKLNVKGNVFYSYWLGITALVALKVKRYLKEDNIYLVSRAHSIDLYEYRHRGNYLPFQKEIVSGFNAIFPISNNGLDYLESKYPDYKLKFKKSYLGTNDYGLQQEKNKKALFSIVTCSNIIPLKRLDLILEAVNLLIQEGKNIHWFCIGDGRDFEKLKALAINKKISSYITFLGRLTNEETINFYSSNYFDLFINASVFEGLPVSIMEAFSFGIPCIATNVGGTSEIVNSANGILLDKDLEASILAKNINNFYSHDVSVKNKYRDNARKQWLEKFDGKKNYEKWINLINSSSSLFLSKKNK